MDHVITTYGGGELFKLIFDGIAALFKANKTGLVMPLIHIGLMVGAVYMLILMFFKSSLAEGAKWLLWVVVATNLLFLPKTTIWIHDPLMNYKEKVDHVPFALGAFASMVSQMGRAVTEKMETVFTLPDYMPYHKTGTVFASSLMSQVGQFRIVDPGFKGNMDRFVNQCIVLDAMIAHKYTLTELQNSNDIWTFISGHASSILGFLYKEEKKPGVIITCKEGAEKLKTLWKGEVEKATKIYGSRVQNRSFTQKAFFTELIKSANMLSQGKSIANNAEHILRQEMMINAIQDSSNNKLSELGVAANYTATKALLQQRSAYAAAGEIAAKTLPLFKNVIEALSYGLFIFIVVLALMPNGYRVLMTYFGILIWTQLWAPLYALLNLIMSLYGSKEGLKYGLDKGLTLLNSSAVINVCADMTTLAAWLSVSIPFISYGILKQGAAAFVGLAQHLGSAMQSAASGAAAETVSGNISLGNVTMGTQAYQNTTAFQHNTSPTYNASQFKSMGTSGIEKNTFADGTQAFNDHGTSQLPVKLIGTRSASMEYQQRLNEAQSVAESTSVAAGKSMEAATQQTANVLERLGSDFSKNASDNKTFTSNEVKALQDHHNFTNDISESLGVSKSRAHELAVAVQAGTPKWLPVSAEGSTRLSGSTAHSEQLQKAQAIADQKGYSYSLDTVLSAAHSDMESRNDVKGAELATSAGASLNQAQHLREEASVAHNKMKEVSDSVASSQREDFQESRDFTQPFLEYVTKQPVNNGPNSASGVVGGDRAAAIIKEGGDEYQTYREGFNKEHPGYDIQRVNTSQGQQALAHQYQAQSNALKADSSLESQHAQNRQAMEQKGKSLGLKQETFEKTPVKDEVQQQHERATKNYEARQEEHSTKSAPLQKKVDEAREENIIHGSIKNLGNIFSGESYLSKALATERLEKMNSESNIQQADASQGQQDLMRQHQTGSSQNHDQNMQEAPHQGNGMGTPSHNASVSSVERVEQGGQIQQTKQESTGNQWQQPSIDNPGQQIAGNSQPTSAPQSEASQTAQTSQNHQVALSQNHGQSTQGISNQGNSIGARVPSHNALTPSIEQRGQEGQSQQTRQETSGNQHQAPSMGNPGQVAGNSQLAMVSQGGSPQNPQTSQIQNVGPSQSHAQNTQGIFNQGNSMRAPTHNASTPSIEHTEQERPTQQTKQGTSGNQQQSSPEKPVQSAGKSQSSTTSQDGMAQTSPIFKEEENSLFKNTDSKIAQSDFAQHEKELRVKPSGVGDPSPVFREKRKENDSTKDK